MKLHTSLDIESLSSRPGGAVISIGAAEFCTDELKILRTFQVNISFETAMTKGLSADGATLDWWFKQSDAARGALFENQKPIISALSEFHNWFNPESKIWGYGADFDVVLLEVVYRRFNFDPPWKYKNIRCGRTLCRVLDIGTDRKEGVHHRAVDDAIAQANAFMLAHKAISGVKGGVRT